MEAEASGESLLSLMTWAMWGLVGLCAAFYFVYSYLFEILAQKLDEPRWMAWVPIVNVLMMLRLVGWEKWFWLILCGYVVALGGMVLPAPLSLIGVVAIFPVSIAALVIGLAYFPRLARRRDLPVTVGLWCILPHFVPPFVEAGMPGSGVWVSLLANVATFAAFLKIVFHDGKPRSGPHPAGYALTLIGVLATGAALQAIPGRLVEDEGFQEAWQAFTAGLESSPMGQVRDLSDASEEAVAEVVPARSPLEEPHPIEIARKCPPGTQETAGPQGTGRAWGCALEGVRHGPYRSWFDNGFVESEGEYDHGRRTGTWTRYWRSGGRRVQAEFRDDVQHGWMHRWDSFGVFETAVRYEDGEPSTL
jgi:hypothetical protein